MNAPAGTIVVSHLYTLIVAFVFMTGIIWGLGWAEKAKVPGKRYTCPVVTGLRAFLFICMATVGLLFMDMLFKQLVLGVFGYGNVMHWLGAALLVGTVGIQFIMAAILVAPTRKGLVTFGTVVATFLYLMHVHFPSLGDGISLQNVLLGLLIVPIIAGTVVQSTLAAIHGIYLKASKSDTPARDAPLWDISEPFKRVFSFKTNLVLWMLLLAEFMLTFEGWGLLAWLSLDGFLGVLAGFAAGSLTLAVVYRRRSMPRTNQPLASSDM